MAKILVVDDSFLCRRNIGEILNKTGHSIIEANNGFEALEELSQQKPDCILTDLSLPEMDGVRLLEYIHAQKIGIPIIVVSEECQNKLEKKCRKLGVSEFVNKPIREDELKQKVEILLEE